MVNITLFFIFEAQLRSNGIIFILYGIKNRTRTNSEKLHEDIFLM